MAEPVRAPLPHPKLALADGIADVLWDAGARFISEPVDAARRVSARKRRSGATLRPGEGTPLWNATVVELRRELAGHGQQARLARVLGVSRQTLNAWLVGLRMPDAERTLQLFAWLVARRSGRNPP